MKSDSNLKETIKGVSLSSLSNYSNHIDFHTFIPVMQDSINQALTNLTVSQRVEKFRSVKLIDSPTISMCMAYFS